MQEFQSRIVLRKSGMLLVEWSDEGQALHRAWVTPEMTKDESKGLITVVGPDRGIPYGVDWTELISLSATPEGIDRELKRVGIWTEADLIAMPQQALGAIQAVYRFDLATLTKRARSKSTEA